MALAAHLKRAAAAAAVALACAAPASAERLELETVLRGMAGTAGVSAHYREVKHIALLREPLETRGELVFVPPDRLARITQYPGRSWLLVDGDRVRLFDEASGEAVDLAGDPAARIFVESFIVLFQGDPDALRERYRVRFDADGDAWSIRLEPRRAPVDRFVESITLRGAARALRSMELVERDGDRAVTTFDHVEVDRRFSEEELARLFDPPAAGPR